MKKIGILLLLSMIVLATSCKKDPVVDPQPTKEELIAGDWQLESLASDDGVVYYSFAGTTDTATFTVQSKNENYQLELNENKSYTASGQMTLIRTTTTDSVEIEEIPVDTTSTGTWVIDGDNLVLTSGAEVTESKILDLTADKLKLESFSIDTTQTVVFGITIDVIVKNTTVTIFKK